MDVLRRCFIKDEEITAGRCEDRKAIQGVSDCEGCKFINSRPSADYVAPASARPLEEPAKERGTICSKCYRKGLVLPARGLCGKCYAAYLAGKKEGAPVVVEQDPSGLKPGEPGAKLDQGKIKAGVLGQFSRALLAVAEVGTHGAEKYSRGGWQSVEDGATRYDDAKWRHLLKGYYEEEDPDSGLKHLAHEAWNSLARLELKLRGEKTK